MSSAGNPRAVGDFIEYWSYTGGSERGNFHKFALELCALLDVPPPEGARAEDGANDYVFEKRVNFRDKGALGFIDLYKRGCFVLEAKQSRKREAQSPLQAAMALEGGKSGARASGVHRDAPGWDQFMRAARNQAESYARALPPDHGWPPFLIIVDVGHVIELYADFTGQGKHYAQFPDRQSYRIPLADLAKPEVRERLKAVWTDPRSLDPARKAAEVTREIAALLAELSRQLERRLGNALPKTLAPQERRAQESLIAGKVATFLMRCLFTMFAEDVKLIREDSFLELLRDYTSDPAHVHIALAQMWRQMDEGEYSPLLKQQLLKFNGKLFKNAEAIPLNGDELNLLILAAQRSWGNVEPAIFGTLLERALDPAERHRLGAHYTPRAYVERLVIPTIIEPLTDDWRTVQAEVTEHLQGGATDKAVGAVAAFHTKLCAMRVLDPACGTGNFLYVAMELMKRLEGEVLDALQQLGQDQYLLELDRHTVDPHQFLGLEINPRAVEIAELVLWIGYLQWHFRTRGKTMPAEPVLKDFKNIVEMDAVLAYDRQDVLRDEDGRVMTRWDGVTTKLHPITGEAVPDPDAKLPIYSYSNPRPAKWPEADFIVGNPPFIGNKRMREALGDGYVDALHKAHKVVPNSVDFVMYWWKTAADRVRTGHTRSSGLITTNSIVQSFNRRVVEGCLQAKPHLRIGFAVRDQHWVDSSDGADVRVSITVVDRVEDRGKLVSYSSDGSVATSEESGEVNPDLTVGANVTGSKLLLSNLGLAHQGVILVGTGFRMSNAYAEQLISRQPAYAAIVKPYLIGRDLVQRRESRFVVDAYGLSEQELRQEYPDAYAWVLERVKPKRDGVRREKTKERWWIFAEPRSEFRSANAGSSRYLATCRTARHRTFEFLTSDVVPDAKIVAIAAESSELLAVLSSSTHAMWSEVFARLGVGNDGNYNHSEAFGKFPFPSLGPAQTARLRALGEELDRFRKERLAQHDFLTMTGLYNVLAKLRSGGELTQKERDIHEAGLVSVLKQLHDDIDAAVADAYGWPRDLSDEQILERLVALNKERAAEEAKGVVHWLRPEYQMARAGLKRPTQATAELDLVAGAAKKPKFPTDLPEQISAVRAALAAEDGPVDAAALAKRFAQGGKVKGRVEELLRTLAAIGQAGAADGRYFAAR